MLWEISTILFLLIGWTRGAWQNGVEIKRIFSQDELDISGIFKGHPEDHLSLLRVSHNNLILGGRDAFYNFSIDTHTSSNKNDLNSFTKISWNVPEDNFETCLIKGQSESKCHNFIRSFHGPLPIIHQPKALALTSLTTPSDHSSGDDSAYLVCGTNGFRPTCRWFSSTIGGDFTGREFSGIGYTPFDPSHMSTSVLHSGAVYSATVADFGGTDPLIYKQPLRTEQYSTVHLNNPSWVSSISYGDLAFFFFRENAIEHSNCGKAIYSRVARICRNDNGSRRQDRFTTFLKARLNCSIPGNIPFYFDYIQGTTPIITNEDSSSRNEMLYAVFTTGENSLRASAVCSFRTSDILSAFDGPFKAQKGLHGNWLPVPEHQVPSPRPGSCSSQMTTNNQDSSSSSTAFLKGHALMDTTIQGTPHLTFTHMWDTFTTIDVDNSPQIAPYHILYIGTDSGKVFKAVVNASSTTDGDGPMTLDQFSESNSVISQSFDVFPGEKIKSIKVLDDRKILVLSETSAQVIRVDNCHRFSSSCGECLYLRDPHCAWDNKASRCVLKDPFNEDKTKDEQLIQDVNGIAPHLCPKESTLSLTAMKKNVDEIINNKASECCPCKEKPTNIAPENDDDDMDEIIDSIIILPGEQTDSLKEDDEEDNEIPGTGREYLGTLRKSAGEDVSSQSLALATSSSAILSLLVGFSLGFLVAKWVSRREKGIKAPKNLTANLNESQRLTSKSMDYSINIGGGSGGGNKSANNSISLKNNLNSSLDTMEKTVKKIYI